MMSKYYLFIFSLLFFSPLFVFAQDDFRMFGMDCSMSDDAVFRCTSNFTDDTIRWDIRFCHSSSSCYNRILDVNSDVSASNSSSIALPHTSSTKYYLSTEGYYDSNNSSGNYQLCEYENSIMECNIHGSDSFDSYPDENSDDVIVEAINQNSNLLLTSLIEVKDKQNHLNNTIDTQAQGFASLIGLLYFTFSIILFGILVFLFHQFFKMFFI